jgi:exopolysaccharide biosynthesis polyprenyl glycosylphosphotransferase
MFRQRAEFVRALHRVFDLGVLVLSAAVVYRLRLGIHTPSSAWPDSALVLGLMVALWWVLLSCFRLYEAPARLSLSAGALRMFTVSVVGFLSAGAVSVALSGRADTLPLVGVFAVVTFFSLLSGRWLLRLVLAGAMAPGSRVLIVGEGPRVEKIRVTIERERCLGIEVVEVVGVGALAARSPGDPASALSQLVSTTVVDEVIFDLNSSDTDNLVDSLTACERLGVIAHVSFDPGNPSSDQPPPKDRDGIQLVTFTRLPHDEKLLFVKRVFDIGVSAVMLVALSPVLALVALAVKLTSPGPVLFRQVRSGAHDRRFTMYKFRSMVANAEAFQAALAGANEVTGPVFKIREDPRLTSIGAFLRRTSLDELPQLWNVLKGEMSLVGPRPAVPSEVAHYEPWQRRRLGMRPGLTCLWQVSGRSQVAFGRWIRLDLEYVDRWSLGLDLWILVRTIPAVLSGRGAS